MLERAKVLTDKGYFDRFEVPGERTTPQGLQRIQGEAESMQNALNPKPEEPKTTNDMVEFMSISGLKPGDPAFGAKFDAWLTKQNHSRATQINMPGALGESTKNKLQQANADDEMLLAKIGDIRSYGDPSKFLGLRSKATNFALGAIASISPESLSEEERQQVADARLFKEDVESTYLQAKVDITGSSGGEKELREIRNAVLSTDMSSPEFNASLDKFERVTRRNMEIRNRLMAQGFDLKSADGKKALSAEIDKAQQAERPKQPQTVKPPPDAAARLEDDFRHNRISRELYEAGKRQLQGAP
jgi:hypothetical protein